MKKNEQYFRVRAQRYAAEVDTFVRLIHARIQWHFQQFDASADDFEKGLHEEFLRRDRRILKKAKKEYEAKKEKKKFGAFLPEIDFKLKLPQPAEAA